MENINTQLKKRIMRRVYTTFLIRKILSPLAVKMYVLAAFVGFSVQFVSVGNVVANMPRLTDLSALYNFSTSAFLNTEFAMQILSAGVLVAIFLLLKDIVKMHSTPRFSSV